MMFIWIFILFRVIELNLTNMLFMQDGNVHVGNMANHHPWGPRTKQKKEKKRQISKEKKDITILDQLIHLKFQLI